MTRPADPPPRNNPDTASGARKLAGHEVPADSTPAGLRSARRRRSDGGANAGGVGFDPAKDTIYSDFSASVQDMLDALQNPTDGGERTRARNAGCARCWWPGSSRTAPPAWRGSCCAASSATIRGWLGACWRHCCGPRCLCTWPSSATLPTRFSSTKAFPGPGLGPWLIALRYGGGYGAAASFGLLAAWAGAPGTEFPRLYFLGGAIAMLIAGEFGSYLRLRVLRLQESLRFLNDKAERLTRRLYLVKLSHDELEYEMVDRPGTLRESLIELRSMMDRYTRSNPHDLSGLPGAQMMLDFVVTQCRVETAALYEVRMEPVLQLQRVAAVGRIVDPPPDDPMVLRALETGHQVHLQDALLESAALVADRGHAADQHRAPAVRPDGDRQGCPFTHGGKPADGGRAAGKLCRLPAPVGQRGRTAQGLARCAARPGGRIGGSRGCALITDWKAAAWCGVPNMRAARKSWMA